MPDWFDQFAAPQRQSSPPDGGQDWFAQFAENAPEQPPPVATTRGPRTQDIVTGLGRSAAGAVIGLGETMAAPMRMIPGVRDYVGTPDEFDAARRIYATPANRTESVSKTVGDVAQFLTPVGAAGKVRAAAEIGKAALLTRAQGGTGAQAAAAAGLAAVVPGAGAVRRLGTTLQASAEPLVRAAVKPTVASLRRITGQGGMDAKANALVRFIIDNRLTTPEKARAMFLNAEHELQRVLRVKNAPTDAATRAGRYLAALERSAAKQGLGAEDVALIRKAADDLLAGPMGEAVQAARPGGTVTRALRADVPASEALESARASSRWTTRKAWGEQKGATMEAAKAVERAQRDAVKSAVPEATALLQTEAKSLQAAEALDRMSQRAANRDVVSLPAHLVAAGEIATGRVPVLAFAANWLRNNQMKAGIWADALSKAIARGNAPLAADILKRLGVGSVAQQRPARATP